MLRKKRDAGVYHCSVTYKSVLVVIADKSITVVVFYGNEVSFSTLSIIIHLFVTLQTIRI